MTDHTRADVCAAAIADAFADDGEIFASPMGLLPTIGARLAKLTSNPDLVVSDGESLWLASAPAIGRTGVVEGWIPFRKVFDIVNYGKRHVMMGATQVDRDGNQNISALGDFAQPTRQLLGSRGAPGNTVNNRTSYWVPRHSPRVFVEAVDVVCGVGPKRARTAGVAASKYNDIYRIVSNLAVFDVRGEGDTVRLLSLHPGVTLEEVVAATGFAFDVLRSASGEVATTREPTSEELHLIRDVLDPKGLRLREVPEPEKAAS
ncbi:MULTISPECIES: CoA-transferase subunit beta [Streptomyces]|uniref:CoA-transferase subunit beta n=2 Tax=Streptomyces TaxID=1883 RepID=A0ABW1E317_9ACTN|nr:hypothetical protein [Streptomyces hirsutus]